MYVSRAPFEFLKSYNAFKILNKWVLGGTQHSTPRVAHRWIQGIELSNLILYLTTFDPNLTISSQLPTRVANLYKTRKTYSTHHPESNDDPIVRETQEVLGHENFKRDLYIAADR
jgi:hypothetical protein